LSVTPYITAAIDYQYGYVFAACCFLGAIVVYFFVCESHGRTLEEIDTMYILHVTPWKSKHWTPTPGEELPNLDNTYLTPGGRGIKKTNEARAPEQLRRESVPVTDADMQASGARRDD
jgi:SP family sugar:H+ symporter-like MFS transporter